MEIKAIKTRIFRENEDILPFILKYIKKVPEKSVLVITSKIVALSEGRTAVCRSEEEKSKLIKKESEWAIKTPLVWLTVKDGMVMASAGIDESNGDGKFILLPTNSFLSAETLRKKLIKKFHIKDFGVLITDSRLMPLRAGTVGGALGYAGFSGIKSYIGKKDIFGRAFKISKVSIADSLAASAVLTMGEGNEKIPLALITGAPIVFTQKVKKDELVMPSKEDIYAPLFKNLTARQPKKRAKSIKK